MKDLKEPLAALFRQYRNEFLTIERFAEYRSAMNAIHEHHSLRLWVNL